MAKDWTTENSYELYNLKGWGLKYFGINEQGNLVVHPRRSSDVSIDIKKVVDDILARGIKLPVLLRFQDLLRQRVMLLNEGFKDAITEYKYQGRYMGVYPIKVNQLREVVEEIADAGEPYQIGLEAGSKGELMAALALNDTQCLTIVNGYKDESIMRLAIIGLKVGKKVIVVIEKPSELGLLLRVAKEYNVRPLIGLRTKLQTQGSGKWKTSTGYAAKFGLTTPEILAAINELRAEGMEDCVKMLHFHVGSQVTQIQTIKEAVKEGARVYAKLRKLGVAVEYLDCGGGLGVDYDGSHTATDSSMNYTLKEYISSLVYTIQEICRQEEVPEPNIVTESGRTLVAHHSLLIVNIFGSIVAGSTPIEFQETPKEHAVVKEMRDIIKTLNSGSLSEAYHDAQQRMEEAFDLFKLGYLDLEDRAKVENIYWRLCLEIRRLMPRAKYHSEDLGEMIKTLDDQYLCNFSLFQSLPDSWAIDHIFPIVPLHRLNEEPERKVSMVDITCDSDGKIDQFAFKKKIRANLPLHRLTGDPYYVAICLVGAYQASLGDIHNLFGRVNEVHIFEDAEEPGGYYIEEIIHGQTVRDVLTATQYSEYELVRMIKTSVDTQVKAGILKPREGVDLLNQYEAVMQEYTYIDHAPEAPVQPMPAPAQPAAAVPASNGHSKEKVPAT
jgi:arginine decarboxylase